MLSIFVKQFYWYVFHLFSHSLSDFLGFLVALPLPQMSTHLLILVKKHKPTVILFMYLIMCNSYFNTREKCRSVGGKKTYCLKKFSAWKSDENKDFAESSGKSEIAVREFGNGLFLVREFGKMKKIVREFGNRPPLRGASLS